MNRKEQQLLRQRQTTRQLMGVTHLTEHGAVCGRDELLFYLLRPDNLSILSPEGFASILWKDSKKAKEAAAVMKLTAADLYQMGMIEHVIPEAEPVSRENINDIAGYLENGIADFLEKYGEEEPEKLLEHRYERFRKM